MQFEFATASQIIFGPGKIELIGSLAAGNGRKALIIAGFRGNNLQRITKHLLDNQIDCEVLQISGEPTLENVEQARTAAIEGKCDLVIGFGGGSALDTAKSAAVMATNPGPVLDYLEVVGANRPITSAPLPFIAVPTTAGTGSEVTRNAVILVPEKNIKVSMRSPLMLARVAIIDPELMLTLPPPITACTGMDALAQVIEPFVSRRANPLVDLYCREGIRRGSAALLRAYQNGLDLNAREEMAFTSLMGGLALANAGLGAVHGFAGPIGGLFDAPHGAVCACLLPAVVAVNARALAERDPQNPALLRYTEVAQMVTGRENAISADLCLWLDELRQALQIPSLRTYGINQANIETLVDMGAAASSMKANPSVLNREELREILARSL